jgi:hypothetical protein
LIIVGAIPVDVFAAIPPSKTLIGNLKTTRRLAYRAKRGTVKASKFVIETLVSVGTSPYIHRHEFERRFKRHR